MAHYLLALDQGTTSSRAIVFGRDGKVVSSAQYPFRQYFPHPGWVEHDPEEILETQFRAMRDAVAAAGILPSDIAAIGITNQRETAIAWDRETGKPVGNAIVWQCRRTAEICEGLIAAGEEAYIKTVTGLPCDAYFSGTKYQWMLDHRPEVKKLADEGRLAFGTVDSWLIYHLTGGQKHVTDVTNASRSLLFDIHKLDYDDRLCDLLRVPKNALPKVLASGDDYGCVNTQKHLLGDFCGIPITAVLGDQQAALFGQKCFAVGDVKNTYGTGCFTLMNIGRNSRLRNDGLLTTVGWSHAGETVWALEGSVFNAGSSVQWLRDELGIIESLSDCDELARSVPDNGGVYLVSAFNGLGAPYWDMYARGGVLGLTRGSTKAHLCRATLEGIAHQVCGLVHAMEAASGQAIRVLKADGGASVNRFMMQFQADLLDTEVVRAGVTETTALGAALMAGWQAGVYESPDDFPTTGGEICYQPAMSAAERDRLLGEWQKAVERVRNWAEN